MTLHYQKSTIKQELAFVYLMMLKLYIRPQDPYEYFSLPSLQFRIHILLILLIHSNVHLPKIDQNINIEFFTFLKNKCVITSKSYSIRNKLCELEFSFFHKLRIGDNFFLIITLLES